MKRLFGTDGIRGVAGRSPLDPATVRTFGAALAEVLSETGAAGDGPRVVLGRDTRESGPWLRDAVVAGVASRGGSTVDAGVVTTPGLAHAARTGGFDAGVMISASHNPFEDNGLKVFSGDGFKLPDSREATLERRMLDDGLEDPGPSDARAEPGETLVETYVASLRDAIDPGVLSGRKILIDASNGSAYAIAPALFRALGADVELLGCAPDGRNINLDCGSLHLDALGTRVAQSGAELGIAYDGDADRCLAVDSRGREIDGDAILYVLARYLRERDRLPGDRVVATVMSNFWLERRLAAEGMTLVRAAVGDKYVLERMHTDGANLGGEQSGHVIVGDVATTGDGILTSLVLLSALASSGTTLDTVVDGITPAPQLLINVRVREKPELREHPEIGPAVRDLEARLDGTGRVVLRYSGTEPVVRVMVEGDDEATVRSEATALAELLRAKIGEG